jgi:hypothetical protein
MGKQMKVFAVIFLTFFALCVLSITAYALIYGNETDGGFGGGGFKTGASSIRTGVIEGAGYFLSSYSDILAFLNKIELAELKGIDYAELQKIIAGAVENMTNAKNTYLTLTQTADVTPYNLEVIEKLIAFDYGAFRREKQLNRVVFSQVESFLARGDIRGVYHRFLSIAEELLVRLNTIKADVDAGRFPFSEALWELNQDAAQALLFGQYTTEVFCRAAAQ